MRYSQATITRCFQLYLWPEGPSSAEWLGVFVAGVYKTESSLSQLSCLAPSDQISTRQITFTAQIFVISSAYLHVGPGKYQTIFRCNSIFSTDPESNSHNLSNSMQSKQLNISFATKGNSCN